MVADWALMLVNRPINQADLYALEWAAALSS
jgi:hypothetical protein